MSKPEAAMPPIVVVSNRGPVAFKTDEKGHPIPTRASGGLVTSLAPAVAQLGATWIAAGKGASAQTEPIDAFGFHYLEQGIAEDDYRRYYDVIANGTLWFLHHNLFDSPRRPRIDRYWWEAWHTYSRVNEAFAHKVCEVAPQNAAVFIHDYHLTMLGSTLREKRPDLRTVHFHHTPFTDHETLATLPDAARIQLLEGLASHDACGFHAQRWADNFTLCCADTIGDVPRTFVSPGAPDTQDLMSAVHSQATITALDELEESVGNRKLIVRVDRLELSKNLLRGFHAFDDVLRQYPRWRNEVVLAAFLYPSREGIADYLAYRNEVESLVSRINDEWSTQEWQPIQLHIADDFPQSVAGLLRYDVLLVNPIRDGLNLVAKEGAAINEREGALVLSRESGVWTELKDAAIGINPFDITGTSDALVHALEMNATEKSMRAARLRAMSLARTSHDWFTDQLNAATFIPQDS